MIVKDNNGTKARHPPQEEGKPTVVGIVLQQECFEGF